MAPTDTITIQPWKRLTAQAGRTTRQYFAARMERNQLSLRQATQAIGMTRRMITYYKSRARPIPKTV
ncbi:hypothetical protein BAE29_06580 [Acidithiobacillus caldus]|jgi:hypothetical protein|nr:hypothetical protein BAE27_11175 [Acidithiobacillus caldus]OFC36629.1 hypothetical protein BAE28_08420 [Acidithiobacillus caldus]OFC39765.1 hypothetical protein BAE29_06580 [Acidithiobacillus caldus]OFC60812.1 hypothetical protein BAE30_07070 [Acidithiobacillus caldus]